MISPTKSDVAVSFDRLHFFFNNKCTSYILIVKDFDVCLREMLSKTNSISSEIGEFSL